MRVANVVKDSVDLSADDLVLLPDRVEFLSALFALGGRERGVGSTEFADDFERLQLQRRVVLMMRPRTIESSDKIGQGVKRAKGSSHSHKLPRLTGPW